MKRGDAVQNINAKLVIGVLAWTVVSAPVHAERRTEIEPSFGTERTATVGSAISNRYSFEVRQAVVAKTTGRGKLLWDMLELPAGEPLMATSSSSKFKACVESDGQPWGMCGLDDDGDGIFDRIARDLSTAAVKLDQPVPYETREVSVPGADRFKQYIIYLGATPDTIRLSYREFVNDMARPAFTEDLTLPLGKTFPQTIAIKDVKMTILSLDGLGLRYRLDR